MTITDEMRRDMQYTAGEARKMVAEFRRLVEASGGDYEVAVGRFTLQLLSQGWQAGQFASMLSTVVMLLETAETALAGPVGIEGVKD